MSAIIKQVMIKRWIDNLSTHQKRSRSDFKTNKKKSTKLLVQNLIIEKRSLLGPINKIKIKRS